MNDHWQNLVDPLALVAVIEATPEDPYRNQPRRLLQVRAKHSPRRAYGRRAERPDRTDEESTR